jgi:hypothetical protein
MPIHELGDHIWKKASTSCIRIGAAMMRSMYIIGTYDKFHSMHQISDDNKSDYSRVNLCYFLLKKMDNDRISQSRK